jgi:hypothetical protein
VTVDAGFSTCSILVLVLVLASGPALALDPPCSTCDNEAAIHAQAAADNEAAIHAQAAADKNWAAAYQAQVDALTTQQSSTLSQWGVRATGVPTNTTTTTTGSGSAWSRWE